MRSLYRSSHRCLAFMALAGIAAISCEYSQRSGVSAEPEPDLDENGASEPVLERAERQIEPAHSPSLSVAVRDSRAQDTPGAAQEPFSIASTRDLLICSSWSALQGEHFETRQFYAPPHGELYYQKLIPFSSDIDEPSPFVHPVSIPHATVIQPVLANERGELVICDALAVAGAWIGDHQITGAWRLEVSLDGAKTPAVIHSFEIIP